MRRSLVPAAAAFLLLGSTAARAQRAAPDALVEASLAIGDGDHRRALELAGPVARNPGPAEDRAEAWRIVGVAQFFLGQHEAARQAFLAYLLLDQGANLDPALYPPEMVNLLAEVRTDHAAEIAAAHPKPGRRRSLWLSFVPVVSQWQNGDRAKMWIIASLGTALLAANVTSYVLLRRWCDPSDGTCDEGEPGNDGYSDHLPEARRARTVNILSAVGLVGLGVYAVIDGRVRYGRLAREEVDAQAGVGVGLSTDGEAMSVTVGGRF